MKVLILALILCIFSTQIFASPIYNKILNIEVDGKPIEFSVTDHAHEYSTFYRSGYPDYAQMLLKKKSETLIEMTIINDSNIAYKYEFPVNVETAIKVNGKKEDIETFSNYYEEDNFEYFHFPAITKNKTKSTLLFKTELFAKKYFDRVDAVGRYFGVLSYNACDGCEHGDKLLIESNYETVNVVKKDFGSFYTEGCDDGLTLWFEQLLELQVEYTWIGTINTAVSDYWDDISDEWMAGEGKITIGNQKHNEVRKFLESMIYKTAIKVGIEPLVFWNEIQENGRFTKYQNGKLTFQYKDVVIETQIVK